MISALANFLRTLPLYYRDKQGSFSNTVADHKKMMESRGCTDGNYVLGYWYISPEQVRF